MIVWVKEHLYLLYSGVLLVFIVNYFISNVYMEYAIGVAAIVLLILSYPGASTLFRTLGIIFSVSGVVFYSYSGLPFYKIPTLMTSTMPLLAFLTVLPFMTSVVHAGRFDRRINQLSNVNVNDLGRLYPRSSFTAYMLTLFINLSALSISQEVLKSNLRAVKKRVRDSFISNATLRAFACAQAWSPMEIIVAITIDSIGINFFVILPWLFLCSVIVICGDWLFGRKKFKSVPYNVGKSGAKTLKTKKILFDILKLLSALMVFLVVVVMMGNYFHLNFILSVTLVLIPFTFIWALLLKRLRTFWIIGWRTWKANTNKLQNFMVLFLSLALFSNSLSETTFSQLVQRPFLAFTDKPLVILIFIQLLFLFMGIVGIHAIVTMGVLVEVLQPLSGIISPLSMGIVLISGAMATATVGPYGVTVTMTSMNTLQNPYRISVRNMPFAIFYCGIGLIIGGLLL
ncbi:hypothetical protein SAMN05192534_13116 [Alteribacillus persepolensis]|uniref:Uncharacterized protein n=1 Tax=Alteribacillus persepolensis TaxID=568899 RepID=A0A1G8JBF1_9BACI|nr:hypothetical protein [Alteribacillus persepolensis]SDI28598.1 hypothetical protein SAMN05192534_13116 [Alteribacillus persepolensis]